MRRIIWAICLKRKPCCLSQAAIKICHKMLTATFIDLLQLYRKQNAIKFYCGSAESVMSHCLCVASRLCGRRVGSFVFCSYFVIFNIGLLLLICLYCFSVGSQWCLWAARSTPLKMALMLSLRSMVGVTTRPPTVRGLSSSLTSREKASKRLLTGEEGGFVFFFFGFFWFFVFRPV